MSRPLAPATIQKIGSELAIAWSDGQETYIAAETLRRACPCATCGGEPDVTGNTIRPKVTHTDASFELSGWEIVGGYGLQPKWADGHQTGIFTYSYLRMLGESPEKQNTANQLRPKN